MSAVGGNYISDGAIMAWLASQQDRVYGELKDSMDLAETRAQLASDLGDIKAHLQEANKSKDFSQVDQELQAFMAKYGQDPQFAQISEQIGPIANKIHENWQYASTQYDADMKQYDQDMADYNSKVDEMAKSGDWTQAIELKKPELPPEPTTQYPDDDVKIWTEQIDAKLDVVSMNDQLTMIHIQELKADIDQSSQLGSSWIAGGDKTIDRIIGNLS